MNYVDRSRVLRSTIDRSVNFVENLSKGRYFEARYVRRTNDYFIVYLSSQSACNQGCKFCHLTTTGQTLPTNASRDEMVKQARIVFEHYRSLDDPARSVNFNFMARGEPLVNDDVDDELLLRLGKFALERSVRPNFLVSTIMPKSMKKSLNERFSLVQPEICYSLYSVNKEFRKKWMPAAMPVDDAMSLLLDWQRQSGKLVKIHYAMIKGQNDDERSVDDVIDVVKRSKLRVNVNLIQYNPPDAESEPATERSYDLAFDAWTKAFPDAVVRIVPKVGFDVKASCGMFVS